MCMYVFISLGRNIIPQAEFEHRKTYYSDYKYIVGHCNKVLQYN